jgi:hypothetical protein
MPPPPAAEAVAVFLVSGYHNAAAAEATGFLNSCFHYERFSARPAAFLQ